MVTDDSKSDTRHEGEPEKKTTKGSTMKALLVVVIALLLLVGAMVAVLMLSGSDGPKKPGSDIAIGDPVLGKQVIMRPDVNCIFCHSVDGSSTQGPTFKGLWGSELKYDDGSSVHVDDAAIRWTLKHPQEKIVEGFGGLMPADIDTKLSENDRVNLLAYLRSIGKGK